MNNEENKVTEKKPLFRKVLIRGFWTIVFGGFIGVVLLFLLASWGVFGKLPTFQELENPDLAVATEVISSDGEILGNIYRTNRVNVTYEQMPQHLIDAVVATEDIRFFKHSGIDFRATARALVYLGSKGGGSTITQQLAKNLLGQGKSRSGIIGKIQRIVLEKSKEYIVSLKLEKRYTKQEILAMYLNQLDFSNNAVGIHTASKVYFSKTVDQLKIEESAVFAGMLQNPAAYRPNRFPEKATNRRNTTLNQMAKYSFAEKIPTPVSKELADSLKAEPIELSFNLDTHNTGLAPYLRSILQNDFLVNWVKNNPKVDGERYDIYRDGLKIYTTIDSRMQKIAEDAVSEHLTDLQEKFDKEKSRSDPWRGQPAKTALALAISNSDRYNSLKRNNEGWSRERVIEEMQIPIEGTTIYDPIKGEIDTLISPFDSIKHHRLMLQSAFVVTDPKTGHVKAWVGGRNFKYFKFDHATTPRQIGSTFKPFLYSVAIDNGWSPCQTFPNLPVTIMLPTGKAWTPKNSGSDLYDGRPITLKDGLAQSMNNISAELINNIGPRTVARMAERAGMKNIPEVHSIALGSTEQTVVDMAQAYSTFINEGISTTPIYVTRIEDKNGNVLQEFANIPKEVMKPDAAYATLQLMRGVVTGGTAVRLGRLGITNWVAGKTGTTNDNTDGWFVGLTPELIGVVWTGCDDPAIHFNSTAYGQGANAALPIWAKFFKGVYDNPELGIDKSATPKAPANFNISFDCDKYYQEQIAVSPGTTTPGTTTIDGVRPRQDEPDEFE